MVEMLADTSQNRRGIGAPREQSPSGDAGSPSDRRPVDVEGLLGEGAPGILERLPPGVVPLLRLAAHERLLNVAVNATRQMSPLEFCEKILRRLSVTVRIENEEELRQAERPVVCANHPSGGLEGLALMAAVCRTHGGCLVPANALLGILPPLAPLIVPVNRSHPSRESAAAVDRAFAGDAPIIVFPAGVTARVRGGRLREFPWASTFVTRARLYGRQILPVHADGRNSWHFYLIHKLRRLFGITLNLEMFLLVDELLRRRGDTITLTFLPPRRVPETNDRNRDRAYAELLRRGVEAAPTGGNHD